MKQTHTTPVPQKAEVNEKAQDRETDRLIDRVIYDLSKLATCKKINLQDRLCAIAYSLRPAIAAFDPADRREIVAKMAVDSLPRRKKTGQFFNTLAGVQGRQPGDYADLGIRIMEKRNPHFHPEGRSRR